MIPILLITAFVMPAIALVTAYMIYSWPEPTVRERYIHQANYFAREILEYVVIAILSIIGGSAFLYGALYLYGQPLSDDALLTTIEYLTYFLAPFYIYGIAKVDLEQADAPPS
jgi:hypothetical protein